MYRVFHQPETRDLPVLFPQTDVELNHGYCPVAAPFDDGLFYDEDAGCFKLWYHAGWFRESDMLRARMVFTGKG